MNLSCLFGHSYANKEEKFELVIVTYKGGNYLYQLYKSKVSICKCCKKVGHKVRGERLERSDYIIRSTFNHYKINVNNLILRVVVKENLKPFIETFNELLKTEYKKQDFTYV